MKTAVFAVFKVTCGRVLCVHRDVSVHTLFDRSNTVKDREPVPSDAGLSELEIGWTWRSPEVTIVVPSLKRPPNVKEPLRVFPCSGFPCSSWCSFVACQYLRTSNVWGGESFCEICSPFSSRSWWRMWIRRRMMQDTRRRRRHLGLGLAGAKERLALAVTCVTRRAFTMVSQLPHLSSALYATSR